MYFSKAPWLPELERLYNAYLRLRPGLRQEIRNRSTIKQQLRDQRAEQNLLGFAMEGRVLQALAIHGPMQRTKPATITMLTHKDTALRLLVKAGILAMEEQLGGGGRGKAHGTRKRIVVSLNAAFPAYEELRALLLTLAGKPATKVRDLSDPRDDYDVSVLFQGRKKRPRSKYYESALLKALLLMNAVADRELDVASLNRMRPENPPFVLHQRMHWLLDQGIVRVRKQGLLLYYGLNPDYHAHKPLKRLLDKIGTVWSDMVDAAVTNDDLKPAKRRVEDRNAKRRRASNS